MKAPSILLLVGTVLVAGSAALLVRVMLKPAPPVVVQQQQPVKAPVRPAILVADRDLKPGEFIDTSAVRWQETEGDHSPLLYFLKSKDDVGVVLGATVRQPISKNEALASNLLVRPGEPGFIAAVLHPGLRAISVPTSAVASNSGLVSTGDRVDVILSLERSKDTSAEENPAAPPRLASQTLLRDVRVLALNNVTRGELNVRNDQDAQKKSNKREYSSYETVTLEVTPAEAEQLAVAKEVGTLQLVLIGAGEPIGEPLDASTGQVTSLAQTTNIYSSFRAPSAAVAPPKVQLFRGTATEKLEMNR